jgi:hypothetical protein
MDRRAARLPALRLSVWSAIAVLFLAPLAAGGPLVAPPADLPHGGKRVHPDPTLLLYTVEKFNVYTGAGLPPEWALAASMTGTPTGGTMDVKIYSEAWRHTDGHLLFAYQIENNSTASVRTGNIANFCPEVAEVLDCGVLDYDGDVAFDQGDILMLRRVGGSSEQLAFAFESIDNNWQTVARLLAPGQTSSWFYVQTDLTLYTTSGSTVQDSGQSAAGMLVLVPVPEPVTMGLMGTGLAGVLALRRRRGR